MCTHPLLAVSKPENTGRKGVIYPMYRDDILYDYQKQSINQSKPDYIYALDT